MDPRLEPGAEVERYAQSLIFLHAAFTKKVLQSFSLMIVPDAAGELIKGTPKELTQREALRLKLKERKC